MDLVTASRDMRVAFLLVMRSSGWMEGCITRVASGCSECYLYLALVPHKTVKQYAKYYSLLTRNSIPLHPKTYIDIW